MSVLMTNPQILLIGGGGHCRSCIDVIEQAGRFHIAGIVEQPSVDASKQILGYPVLGTDDDLARLRKDYQYALVTVGQIKSPDIRMQLFDKLLELGFELPAIISPSAYVSRHARIGQGTIVMHQALVNPGAEVGANCIINSKALVEHDVTIADHCHIATGAIINGAVQIGLGCFVGSGCKVKEGIKLNSDCLVGMGLILRKDQPKGSRILS